MANPAPYESFPVPPEAPYTYDDPRLLYDESCFFYDGGYNLFCLYGDVKLSTRRIKGAASGAVTIKTYPQPTMIDLLFKTRLEFVNDEEYNFEYEIKKFLFKKESNIDIKIKNFSVKKIKYVLTSEYFSPKIINKNLKTIDILVKETKPTVSSSNLELKIKSYISSSLKLNKPRKIKFKATILKKK